MNSLPIPVAGYGVVTLAKVSAGVWAHPSGLRLVRIGSKWHACVRVDRKAGYSVVGEDRPVADWLARHSVCAWGQGHTLHELVRRISLAARVEAIPVRQD